MVDATPASVAAAAMVVAAAAAAVVVANRSGGIFDASLLFSRVAQLSCAISDIRETRVYVNREQRKTKEPTGEVGKDLQKHAQCTCSLQGSNL